MIILVNAFWYDFTFYFSSLTVSSAKDAIKNKNERDLKLFQPYLCSMIAISVFANHQNAHLHI